MRGVVVLLLLPSSHNRSRCTPYGRGTKVVDKLCSSSVGDHVEQQPLPSALLTAASVTVVELSYLVRLYLHWLVLHLLLLSNAGRAESRPGLEQSFTTTWHSPHVKRPGPSLICLPCMR